jgi:hypothetical protein
LTCNSPSCTLSAIIKCFVICNAFEITSSEKLPRFSATEPQARSMMALSPSSTFRQPPQVITTLTHQHKQSGLLSHPRCLLRQARTGRSTQRTLRTMRSQKRRSLLSRMSKKLVRANSTQFLIHFQGYTSLKDLRSSSLRRRVTEARKANQREANKRQRENWSQGTLQTTGRIQTF